MNDVVRLFERLVAAGHNPYRMTLHQCLAFDRAALERKREEMIEAMLVARAAQHADNKAFDKILAELEAFGAQHQQHPDDAVDLDDYDG